MDECFLRLFSEVNRDAALEMSYKPRPSYIARCRELGIEPPRAFFDPKLRSLHPWVARRPRSVSRLSILLALKELIPPSELLSVFDAEKLCELTGKGYPPLISFFPPKQLNLNLTLCDPMAGGGSIPLESVLLGLNTVAFDYNPVAYLILKGAIEYPLRFGEDLSRRVEEEAKKLISYAETMLGRFYGVHDDAYIFTKRVECPSCGGKLSLSSANFSFLGDFAVVVREGKEKVKASCGRCGSKFVVDKRKLLHNWSRKHVKVVSSLFSKGEVDLEDILEAHPLLVIKRDDGVYVPAVEKDIDLFIKACDALADNSAELANFLPFDEIPRENDVFRPISSYGLTSWIHIFNPRQLLALGSLTKYVVERGEELSSKDGELGAAITLYLSFGLSKMVDFNTVLTTWNFSNKSIRDTIGQYALSREIDLNVSYCEAVVPYKNLPWAFEPGAEGSTGGGICPLLDELCRQTRNVKANVRILQFDAKKTHMLGSELVDIVNVDPPYFDQHIYSDFSEFFWVTTKRCLGNFFGKYFFVEKVGELEGWKHIEWNPKLPYVPRSDELIVRRKSDESDVEKYRRNLASFLRSVYLSLKKDGKLVLWFTHKSWSAWESILRAVYISNFKVIDLYPFVSEHPTRSVTMRGEAKLNRTIIIVASKKYEPLMDIDSDVYDFCIKVYSMLNHAKVLPSEKIGFPEKALTLAVAGTARMTILESEDKEDFFEREIVPRGVALGLLSLLRITAKEKGLKDPVGEIESMEGTEKAALLLNLASTAFGKVNHDLTKKLCSFCGTSLRELKEKRAIMEKGRTIIVTKTQPALDGLNIQEGGQV
ncbi:MAG: hypothetical protein QXN15_07520 [Candidatus Jordarchaeales archaeon]|nr:DUF1156 domain-containing protein [Candidatus Jordarchaeia archaeon]